MTDPASIVWSGPEFEKKCEDHLRAQANRQRVSPAMEDRLLQMLGDRRVEEHDQTMIALSRRGLVCRRLRPVNMLWCDAYYILSDLGIRQAERILSDRLQETADA